MKKQILLSIALLLSGGISSLSAIDFSAPYQVNPPVNGSYSTQTSGTSYYGAWTAEFVNDSNTAGSTVYTMVAPGSVTLDLTAANFTPNLSLGSGFSLQTTVNPSDTLSFSAIVPLSAPTGLVSFDYNYTESTTQGSGDPNVFYFINNNAPVLITASNNTGNMSFSVNPGDTFGFLLSIESQFGFASTQNEGSFGVLDLPGSAGNLVINNFSAPVPEPSSLALCAVAIAGLWARRRPRVA